MSILVTNLIKEFGQQKAVDDVSFSVSKGEIVAFLGPNGAGKSTTMKIITGFLPPTSGTVLVDGDNVAQQPMLVKRKTGYLPEHNPLYLDMYVHEYLGFMAGICGLKPSMRKERVAEMVDLCGITQEQNKKIGMLSKGFRQRVGLAQALLHNPSVLVLDEPTSGLDPNQLIEIRNLIQTVSKDKTVLFSTHILQEAEAICHRVIVIDKGKIVADDRLANIVQGAGNFLIVEFATEAGVEELAKVDGVEKVSKLSDFRYRVKVSGDQDVRPSLVGFASEKGLSLIGLQREENSLESVFGRLTHYGEKKQEGQ
jgi:ABC-2 type transport system ATP-binding protein